MQLCCYMCICIYAYIHIQISSCVFTHIYMCIYIYMYRYIHAGIYTDAHNMKLMHAYLLSKFRRTLYAYARIALLCRTLLWLRLQALRPPWHAAPLCLRQALRLPWHTAPLCLRQAHRDQRLRLLVPFTRTPWILLRIKCWRMLLFLRLPKSRRNPRRVWS